MRKFSLFLLLCGLVLCPAPVKISHDRMPLSEFLNTFGLTLQDVKNQLK